MNPLSIPAEPLDSQKIARFAFDLSLTIGITVVALFLAELSLHLCGARFEASLFQIDPTRSYSFRPGARGWHTSEKDVYVQINRQGNRDRDRSFAPTAGTLRIAVLGSSTTAALEVEQQETYTARIEQALSRPGAPVEVLNFAVEGYGPAQDYYTLRDQVWRYHPQIVMDEVSLKQYVLNSSRKYSTTKLSYPFFKVVNGTAVPDEASAVVRRPTQQEVLRSNRFRDVVNSSELALLATSAIKQAKSNLSNTIHFGSGRARNRVEPRSDPWRWTLIPPPCQEIEQAWDVFEKVIALMRDESASHGAEFWVIASDDAFQVNPDPAIAENLRLEMKAADLDYGDDRFDSFLTAQNINHIRLEPKLLSYVRATGRYLHGGPKSPRGTGHWNVLGHRVVAHIISEELHSSDLFQKWSAIQSAPSRSEFESRR